MTRQEIEQRLVELERGIETSKTAIWLAEHERLQLHNELRRLIYVDSVKGAGDV